MFLQLPLAAEDPLRVMEVTQNLAVAEQQLLLLEADAVEMKA